MADQATFEVEVLTPEGEVFRGEAVQLSTRTVEGEVGILANHVPILAGLRPTRLRLQLAGGERVEFAQAHGILQMFGNQAEVLVEEALPTGELDPAALEAELEKARAREADEEAGEAARAVAARDVERISTFLEIAREN